MNFMSSGLLLIPLKVITIEGDDLDFENRPEDFAAITDRIDAQLFGLF